MTSLVKKNLPAVFAFLILLVIFVPTVSFALSPGELIVCKGTSDDPCTFAKAVELFQKGVKVLLEIATLATVIAFVFLGFIFLTSQGNPKALSELKSRSWSILKGYFFILAAWVIVYTILKVLVKSDFILLKP